MSEPAQRSEVARVKTCAGTTKRPGQAMTEFALLVPVMLMMVLGIFEAGRFFYIASAVANAAREGARYGITHAGDSSGIRSRAMNSSPELGITTGDVDVDCEPSCVHGNQVVVQIAYTFSPITPLLPNFELQRKATMRIESP